MKCLADDILRARLDGELEDNLAKRVDLHLASCLGCQQRSEQINCQSRRVGGLVSGLGPLPGEEPPDPERAFDRFLSAHPPRDIPAQSFFRRLLEPKWRPVWGAAVACSVIAIFLSFAPARSWAQKVLGLLRVEKIALIPVDPAVIQAENPGGRTARLVGQLLSDNVMVTRSPGKPVSASSAVEASQLAGFPVRLVTARPDPPHLEVLGERAFQVTLSRDRLQAILEDAGRSDLNLPESVDGATIAVHVPNGVLAKYGNCSAARGRFGSGSSETGRQGADAGIECVTLMQIPSPAVRVPPNLNLEQLAELGLQLAGMSPEEARTFCRTVDWTSTLVIPLPPAIGSYETTEVDGVQGTVIELPSRRGREPARYAAIWVKNGIIYSLTGPGDPAAGITLADSLSP